jgi:hypothetical protein
MHAGSELQTMHLVHLIFKTLSIYENRKNLFKEVYFWNKIKNRIKNHGFVFEMGVTEKFTTLVVIGTDSIGSYKSSYLRSQPRRPLKIVKVLYGML